MIHLLLILFLLWNLLSHGDSVTSYLINSFAGVSGQSGNSGDGGKASVALLKQPMGIFVDSLGSCYIADYSACVIRKIDSSNIVTTFAGTGASTSAGNGVPATSASFNLVSGVWADSQGKFYLSEVAGCNIRTVSTVNFIVSAFAGTGSSSPNAVDANGDNGAASAASVSGPYAVFGDSIGNLYFTDTNNQKLRKISASAIISTIAGSGAQTFTGDGFAASVATLQSPQGVFVDTSGNVVVSDTSNYRIRRISSSLIISTVAGVGGTFVDNTDNGSPATVVNIFNPIGVWMDTNGNMFYAAMNNCNVRISTATTNLVYTIAGTGASTSTGDGGPATSATIIDPRYVYGTSSGNLVVSDKAASNVRLLSNLNPTMAPTTAAPSVAPTVVYKIFRFAGSTHTDYTSSGDGGNSLQASINPDGFHMASTGEIYIAENFPCKIRIIDTFGIINAYAATSTNYVVSGDGGPVSSAKVYYPMGITADSLGNVFWSDNNGNVIRRVSNGIVALYAGSTSTSGSFNSPVLTSSTFYNIVNLCSDTNGNVYAADATSVRIRKVSSTVGTSTIAGTGQPTFNGAGKAASSTALSPSGVYVDTTGNVFITDSTSNLVYMVSGSNNILSVLAGRTSTGLQYIDSSVVATSAAVSGSKGLSGDTNGNVFIAASGNAVLRKVSVSSGIISTIGGNGNSNTYDGDGGPATAATWPVPYMVQVATTGNIYGCDSYQKVIRLLTSPSGIPTANPSCTPTMKPTASPSYSRIPTVVPTIRPTLTPSVIPSVTPSRFPTTAPSASPSAEPSTATPTTHAPTLPATRTFWITAFAGTAGSAGFCCDNNGPATSAQLNHPNGVFANTLGYVYIADALNGLIRTVDNGGIIGRMNAHNTDSPLVGPVSSCTISAPSTLVGDTSGVIYIVSNFAVSVYKISANGIISGFAGLTGESLSPSNELGDGGPATSGLFKSIYDIALDTAGNVYLADSDDFRVRKISTSNIVTTIVGDNIADTTGDDGPASCARVDGMDSVFVDTIGRLFLIDFNTGYIRVVSTAGIITAFTSPSSNNYDDGVPASSAGFQYGSCVRVDTIGNVYVIDQGNNNVKMVSTVNGLIYRVAFDGSSYYSGDNGPALLASTQTITRLAVDTLGNVYVSNMDSAGSTVRKLNNWAAPTGVPSFAPSQYPQGKSYQLEAFLGATNNGTDFCCYGTLSDITSTLMNFPVGIYADTQGIVYICDSGNELIKKVDTDGIVSTLNLKSDDADQESGPVSSCFISKPYGILGDSTGNLFVIAVFQANIRKIDANGFVGPYAGSEIADDSMALNGDGGPMTSAKFQLLSDLWMDSIGTIYLADSGNNKIRKLSASGIVTTFAGTGDLNTSPDGFPATSMAFYGMDSLFIDTLGVVYFCDASSNRIHYIPASGIVTRFAGIDDETGPDQDDLLATNSLLHYPGSIRGDSTGNIYFLDYYIATVRMVAVSNGRIYSLGGSREQGNSGDGGPALLGRFFWINRISLDTAGNIYVSDGKETINRVRKMVYEATPTVAPTAFPTSYPNTRVFQFQSLLGLSYYAEFCCDGPTPASSTLLQNPYGLWLNSLGSLYVTDMDYKVARMMSTNEIVTNINDRSGPVAYGPVSSCAFLNPAAIFGDSLGTIYVSSTNYKKVDKISNGVLSAFLGTGSDAGYTGDYGPGTATCFGGVFDFWIDSTGSLYVDDSDHNKLRVVSPSGIITTLAGNGTAGNSGNGGPATSATIAGMDSVFVDTSGKIFLIDYLSQCVRVISASGIISLYAGAAAGSSSDDTPATSFLFNWPGSVRGDTSGNIYLIDQYSFTLKMIAIGNQHIYSIAGDGGQGGSGDGGPALAGKLSSPGRIALDTSGNVYVSDSDTHTVRKLIYEATPTVSPTRAPSCQPTRSPTTTQPSIGPTQPPTVKPTRSPTAKPTTAAPTVVPSLTPTVIPSVTPSVMPTSPPVAFLTYYTISTIAGIASTQGDLTGNGGPAVSAHISDPYGIWQDTSGVIYFGDINNNRIAYISATGILNQWTAVGSITSVWGNSVGQLYALQSSLYKVWRYTNSASRSTYVGTGSAGSTGDGGKATSATIGFVESICGNSVGDLYIADSDYSRIRKVTSEGIIDVVAGSGAPSYVDTNGVATSIALTNAKAVFVDSAGSLYISNSLGYTILKLASTGTLTTVAGVGLSGFNGDGQAATSTYLGLPYGLWGDAFGNLFFVDKNTRVRAAAGSLVYTIAGTGVSGSTAGDGGAASSAVFNNALFLCGDSHANIVVTDNLDNVIRKLNNMDPTVLPTTAPSFSPTVVPSVSPSYAPSVLPTIAPTHEPTSPPSIHPTQLPTVAPSVIPTESPSILPSKEPSIIPTNLPTLLPSIIPTVIPSIAPSETPTVMPSMAPTVSPSLVPSECPSLTPSMQPTLVPTESPSILPSIVPTVSPSQLPSTKPTQSPSVAPSLSPTVLPSLAPSTAPSIVPTANPSATPTHFPTVRPSVAPSIVPSQVPSTKPSASPSLTPTQYPSSQPSSQPSRQPKGQPVSYPTGLPSMKPSDQPTSQPTTQPVSRPSSQPSAQPSRRPSTQPTRQPSSKPTSQPLLRPTSQPSRQPTSHPSMEPTVTQTSAAPSAVDAYVYIPAATLPSKKDISVIGMPAGNTSTFRIVLPFLVVTPVPNRNTFSNIVLPRNGSYGTGFVVFGGKTRTSYAVPDSSVFSFDGAVSPEPNRRSAALLKDFNGDGYRDLIIGDPYVSRCYVLFGTEYGVTNMTQGLTIFGELESDLTGWSVSDAGDVNKDSLNDLIIGAPNANGNGAFYVLYGSRRVLYDIYLWNLTASQGFAVYSTVKTDALGVSVNNAGDMNRDGYDDVVVGAVMTSAYNAGAAFVFYGGKSLFSIVDISLMSPMQGFKMVGTSYSLLGYSVAGVGDVNGDGFADILIGSCSQKSGVSDAAYVVYGSNVSVSGAVSLSPSSLFGGVYISGAGVMVSSVGDVNRDGYSDLLIGGSFDFATHSTGYVFVNRVGYIASPTTRPTVSPTSTRTPSVSPSIKPTVSPTFKATLKPTIQPSFFPSNPTLLPTHGATEPTSRPSSNPTFPTLAPSQLPTIVPTEAPSETPTLTPTCEPTETPSVAPTLTPSLLPSVMPVEPPSTAPSMAPTVSSTRPPKNYPTLMPSTIQPTWSGATPVVVTNAVLLENPNLERTSQDLKFVFNCSVDVRVTGTGGADLFEILPLPKVTITLDYFNHTSDVINLEAFHEITEYEQINMTKGSVLIHLPNNQMMKIMNLNPVNMTPSHFVLYQAVPTKKDVNGFIGNLLIVSYCVIAVGSILAIGGVYLYVRRKRRIKLAVKETTARIARQSALLAQRRGEPIHVAQHMNKNRVYLYTINISADVKRRDSQPLHIYAKVDDAVNDDTEEGEEGSGSNSVNTERTAADNADNEAAPREDEEEIESISFNYSVNLSDFSIDSEGNCYAVGTDDQDWDGEDSIENLEGVEEVDEDYVEGEEGDNENELQPEEADDEYYYEEEDEEEFQEEMYSLQSAPYRPERSAHQQHPPGGY